MTISKVAIYLVGQILQGNLTYKEIITKKPTLQEQIDAYIEQESITIDKTV